MSTAPLTSADKPRSRQPISGPVRRDALLALVAGALGVKLAVELEDPEAGARQLAVVLDALALAETALDQLPRKEHP